MKKTYEITVNLVVEKSLCVEAENAEEAFNIAEDVITSTEIPVYPEDVSDYDMWLTKQ